MVNFASTVEPQNQVTKNYTKLCFLVSVVQWMLNGFNQKASTRSHSRWQNRLRPFYYSGRSGCPWTLWTLFGDADYGTKMPKLAL